MQDRRRGGRLGSLVNLRPPPSMDLVHGFGFVSSSGQSNFWTARNPSYRGSATFCVHEATLRWARTRRFCACNSFCSAWRRRLRWERSEIWLIDMPGASLRFQNIVYITGDAQRSARPWRRRAHNAECGSFRCIPPGPTHSRCRSDDPAARGINWRTNSTPLPAAMRLLADPIFYTLLVADAATSL